MNTNRFGAIAATLLVAGQAMAQWNQPAEIPAAGDYGAYSTRDQAFGLSDPYYAKAYDNFTLDTDVLVNGFHWTGIYAEPFPTDGMGNPAPKDTDFIVEIWRADPTLSDLPDVWNGPVLAYTFEGGSTAGMGGSDLDVTALGYQSPSTETTFGGGEAYAYDAPVTATSLMAGKYWISIWADQDVTTPDQYDPEWQWHLGDGPGDGFTNFDRGNDPPGTLQVGIFQPGKDLAFGIKVVPEPASSLMAFVSLGALGLLRRKRNK